ncbi:MULTISPECIES: hypothetical protein [Vibrio]|nr:MULTISPECIES: hypothetical protein [Vibrio]EHR0228741.1 hypothetical protein [Vibrio parahaemolyticus]EIO3704329.1 hypothetical protein [Vibrio parahaemolyticus]EIV8506757.1 hypothetical protein [Vibrio parahaemolyticus]ELA9872605.1 hypothetical protein [Vibrio parahaemolyticus]MBT0014463.1 hypothetical protein [Vibrio alginolyticus]
MPRIKQTRQPLALLLSEFKNAHCLPTSDQRVREKPQETIDLLFKQYELA